MFYIASIILFYNSINLYFLQISEDSLKNTFSCKGRITDVKLKYKNGVFRQYCFIGFEKDEDAVSAVDHFDGSFIKQNKISVQLCTPDSGENHKL